MGSLSAIAAEFIGDDPGLLHASVLHVLFPLLPILLELEGLPGLGSGLLAGAKAEIVLEFQHRQRVPRAPGVQIKS